MKYNCIYQAWRRSGYYYPQYFYFLFSLSSRISLMYVFLSRTNSFLLTLITLSDIEIFRFPREKDILSPVRFRIKFRILLIIRSISFFLHLSPVLSDRSVFYYYAYYHIYLFHSPRKIDLSLTDIWKLIKEISYFHVFHRTKVKR
jgi:hypothetical protein